ncbi:MAG: hypothetical protein KQI78_25665, partial [Deltaproteobacteria bacterium]|nr:hypothetical protein [Deltaproteobacteria bacterium]
MKRVEEKRHFSSYQVLATTFILFGLIFTTFIPITNLIQINLANAAPLALPPETQYAGTDTGLRYDDQVSSYFNIGFTFNYYGNTYTQFQATTNGLLGFGGGPSNTWTNTTIPNSSAPNNSIFVFWDDLYPREANADVLYRTIGEVGNRELIVQWTNYGFYSYPDVPMGTFQVILYEGSNNIRMQYRQLLTEGHSFGESATIGLENATGTVAATYSYNTKSLDSEQAILWSWNGLNNYTYNSGAAYEGVYLYKDNPPPNVPELVSPSNGAAGVSTTPTFTWNAADGATSYNLVVSTSSSLSSPVINQSGLTSTSYEASGLSIGPTYYWGVEAINAYGNSWSSIWNFTTASGNSAPSDINLSNTSIGQGLPSGTTVGTLSTTDPDEEDTHTYSLVTGGGSADNESFTISGSTLMTAESLSQGDYTIRVRSSDGQAYVEKVFTISVTEVNVGPTDIALSHYSFSENLPAGTEIATLSTTDANASDTFTYSFVSGTGDADNSAFTITGSSLTINAIPDYETQTSYSIFVRSTDSGGLHVDKQFTIIVTDLDDDTIITVLSDTPDPTVVGEPFTVSVSVAPAYGAGTPTGEFDVSDGTNSCTGTLSAGTGSCSLTSSTSGSKTLNITYVGSLGWNLSTTTTPHIVNQADTTTTITSINSEPSELGSEYKIHFSVIPNAPSTATVASGTVV